MLTLFNKKKNFLPIENVNLTPEQKNYVMKKISHLLTAYENQFNNRILKTEKEKHKRFFKRTTLLNSNIDILKAEHTALDELSNLRHKLMFNDLEPEDVEILNKHLLGTRFRFNLFQL